MAKQEHRTHVNSRVRIKDSVTHMYQNARAYGEAVVTRHKHDEFGYPLIFVEWDKDHWAYSGEKDGWTLEAHFDPLEDDEEMENSDELVKALADLVAKFQEKEEPEVKELAKDPKDPRDDRGMTYDQVLNDAMDDARDAEAFIVLVAKPESFNESEFAVPHVYVHSKRKDAALFLNAVMADVAAQTYAELVLSMIAEAKRNGSSES
jgi:hypothetical protein